MSGRAGGPVEPPTDAGPSVRPQPAEIVGCTPGVNAFVPEPAPSEPPVTPTSRPPSHELRFPLESDELIAFAGSLGLASRLRDGVDAWRRESGSGGREYPRLDGTTLLVPTDAVAVVVRCLREDEDAPAYAGLLERLGRARGLRPV